MAAQCAVSVDYLTKVAVRNKASSEIKVSEIMTERSKLMTVDPNHTTMDAMTMMIKHNFRHVPVVKALLILIYLYQAHGYPIAAEDCCLSAVKEKSSGLGSCLLLPQT